MRTAVSRCIWIGLLAAMLLGFGGAASATSVGHAWLPSLPSEDGAELFLVSPKHGTRNVALAFELWDSAWPWTDHEWGIYFAGDPDTRIPVFREGDWLPIQEARIDFDAGIVKDLDASTTESTFDASLGAFGFYLFVDKSHGSDVLLFSESALNPGGVDAFSSFALFGDPRVRLLAFEVHGKKYALELVKGVVPVPEPTTILGLLGGLGLLTAGRRRTSAPTRI